MIEVHGKYTDAHIMIDEVDNTTMSQVVEMINNEVFVNPVAIMPDCHAGKGSVIGFTMEMDDKIIPNIVSVDIGCGMLSFRVGSSFLSHMRKDQVDREIRKVVPFGTKVRQNVSKHFDMNLFARDCNQRLINLHNEYSRRQNFMDLKKKCESVGINDIDMISLVYENCFEGYNHNLPDDVISCLERID